MRTKDLLQAIRNGGDMPRHVAVIMDGNGRWARGRHMPRVFGHRSGMTAVREVMEGAVEAGLEFLSLFAFSQENWERPAAEVEALMDLLVEYVGREIEELEKKGIKDFQLFYALNTLKRLGPGGTAVASSGGQPKSRR